MKILKDVSLKLLNTFGINASAKLFTEFYSVDDAKEILSEPSIRNENKLILGGGSNLLFTRNFNGAVLKNQIHGIEVIHEDDVHYFVKAGAGENWHRFVTYCIENNMAGLENLSLIPGNVGASPMQNIGAYGVEIKDRFLQLEALNIQTRELEKFNASDCKFGYRESVFKKELKNQFIITSVTYALLKKPEFNISYGAIGTELEKMGIQDLSIAAISEAVCNIRRSKLPDPVVIGNAGSFFKNPVISITHFEELFIKFPDIVHYQVSGAEMKIAAGWLIEKLGWKGQRFGDAGVHKNQALVLVNYGDAKGEEILELSTKIINSVKENFGIELEREVNII